ncbi:T9SS type A sorting domain-containing protein [Seonamhaeicola sp. MEBiC1930]|uniref:T9SS type A sorting domain-containing protein n=1 Tax=Seonamhaeicola sp. MEBiC01930 TaxID=2976768 RepID=UPI00324B684B
MKHLLLSILIICSIKCFTQEPNPDLFQTWYMYSFLANDGSEKPYEFNGIENPITPFLVIMENLTFQGSGACNTFDGTFKLSIHDVLETDQFSNSTNDCSIDTHNLFEDEYFSFFQLASGYSITSEVNGMVLTINTADFGQAVYKNFTTLDTSDFNLSKIKIYPNPSKSIIYVKSQNTSITKIELHNSYGQNLKTINNKFKTIEISDLDIGIYLMKIFTEFGTLNKKIIKK